MQAIGKYKCVFGRNLYNTDETNSILEIRLTPYCPNFEEIKSSFLNVADFLNLRVVTILILMQVSFIIFGSAYTRTKILWCALESRALKWSWIDSHACMVLSDEAVHSDQRGGGKVESASIQFSSR